LIELLLGKNIREGRTLAKDPPKLKVIESSPKANPLLPPPGLGEAGAKLWDAIQADYVVDDAGGLAMLQQICAAADRVAEYSARSWGTG
jgi:hypothetical protein